MSNTTTQQRKWLFSNKWPLYLKDPDAQPYIPLKETERWRRLAKMFNLSRNARLRLDWIIYFYEHKNVSFTCRHYGISRKTFYKWWNVFDRDNVHSMKLLEDKSRAPHHVRQWEITPLQEHRIIQLRKKRIRYGKMKIAKLYHDEYGETISSWKVQRVIEKRKLYYNPIKTAKIRKKRQRSQNKKRITELQKVPWYQKKAGYIICLDTVTIHWNGLKRYIFTALDKYGKVAYARMYTTKSSMNGRDFLYRLWFLFDGQVPRVGHDNGSEFAKYFLAACKELFIEQYYSRVKTPTDNPNNERFNRTLQEEFIDLGNFTPDVDEFNRRLTGWLIEYNFKRPHETLGYQTPMKFSKVLPMYSSCT